MSNGLAVLHEFDPVRTAEQSVTAAQMPLGTAGWHQPIAMPPSRDDFWAGRLPTNGAPFVRRDDRHVLIASGTRAGKGASVLIPNLCLWPGSVVVIDPKGENAMVTARRRGMGSPYCHGMGQLVQILDPFNTVATPNDDFSDLKVAFNPLDLIRPDKEESVDDAARVAEALIVSEGSKEPFWDDSAKGFLKAIILHVASSEDYQPAERNLTTVRKLLVAGDAQFRDMVRMQSDDGKAPPGLFLLFERMQRNPAFGGVVANAGERFGQMEMASPRTLASILVTVCTNTDFIDSPAMQRCLARSDFALEELKTDSDGQTLYVCLPQRFMETHFRWLRMMATLVITEMERVPSRPASRCPVLMVLDEFASLKRMRVIENAAAQIAGFGVKMTFVVQTLAQLKDIYKDNWETLVANAGLKLFFGNDDHFTRDYVSRLVGECEITRVTHSGSNTSGQSESESSSNTKGTSFSESFTKTWGEAAGRGGSSYNNGGSMTTTYGHSSSATSGHTTGTSRSYTEGWSESIHKRLLITPDEVGRWFGNRDNLTALALVSGWQPLFLHRVLYFRDERFAGLFDVHRDHAAPPTLEEREQWRLEEERRQLEASRQQIAADVEAVCAAVEAKEHTAKLTRVRRRVIAALIVGSALCVIEGLSFWYLSRFGCSWKCVFVPLTFMFD